MADLSTWRQFARHPLSEIFPDMEDASFEAMTADMKQNGYDNRQQVLLFENMVLDGWHRLRSAVITGKTPTFDVYKGTDPLGEVVRRNLTRRHMDASQRAMVAAKIVNIRRPGRPSGKTDIAENSAISTGQAAELMNVNRETVRHASTVTSKGTPQLQQAVQNGTISVSDAAKVVNEPPKVQNAAVNDVKRGRAPTANGAVHRRKSASSPSDADESVVRDQEGHVVPEPIRAAFQAAFDRAVSLCQELQKLIDELATAPGGEQLAKFVQAKKSGERIIQRSQHLDALKQDLKGTRPHAVCPYCKGTQKKNCKGCAGTGWVTKTTWDGCDDSTKGRLAK